MEIKKNTIAFSRACKRSKQAKGKTDEAESHGLSPYFDNLPSQLTAHILLQLPIKSLLICRCVCKNWETIISEPHFARLHFERAPTCFMIRAIDKRLVSRTLHLLECDPVNFEIGSNNHVKLHPIFKLPLRDAKSFFDKKDKIKNKPKPNNDNGGRQRFHISSRTNHDKFSVVNSCNGLLCLCHPSNRKPLVICNPLTGEFIRLPEATTTPITLNTTQVRIETMVGFGFQLQTNEYKVIKLWVKHVRPGDDWVFKRVILEIHTLGTPSWRNVEVDPHISISRLKHPTSMNDTLHWIDLDDQKISILCFNFESERLQSFPSPPLVFKYNFGNLGTEQIIMGKLREFLYICDASSLHDVSMWVMKKYGIGESWTKVYNIDTFRSPELSPKFGLCWPVKHFEEGAAILLYLYRSNCFIYYEPEKYGFKVFRFHGIQSKYFELIPHIPSLISLKDIVEGDNVQVLNIHSRCAKVKLREEDEVLSLVQELVNDSISTPSDMLNHFNIIW